MKRLVVISAGSLLALGIPAAIALKGNTSASVDNPAPVEPQSTVSPNISNQSKLSIDSDSESHGSDGSSNNTTNLKVNGQDIEVPENGSLHKQIESDGHKTTIDVESHSSSSDDGSHNTQSTNLNISSHSSASGSSSASND